MIKLRSLRNLTLSILFLTWAVSPALSQSIEHVESKTPALAGTTLVLESSEFRQLVSVQSPSGVLAQFVFEPGDTPSIDLEAIDALATSYEGTYAFNVRFVDANKPLSETAARETLYDRVRVGAEQAETQETDSGPGQGPQFITSSLIEDADGAPVFRLSDTTAGEDDWSMGSDSVQDESFGIAWERFDFGAFSFPFVIEPDINNYALFLESGGPAGRADIGINTNAPATTLHLTDSIPRITFDDATQPQIWTLRGDSVEFSVINSTLGETPFSIDNDFDGLLRLASNGNIGINETNPTSMLSLTGDSSRDAKLDINQTIDPVRAQRSLLSLRNNGTIRVEYSDVSAGGATWLTKTSANKFFITKAGQGNLFFIDSAGNINITGVVNEGSTRASKTDLQRVDADTILDGVAALPLTSWRYTKDPKSVRHLGPMAEDFHEAFGLGADAQHIASGDRGGVALAAIQALRKNQQRLEQESSELRAVNEQLQRLEEESAQLRAVNDQLQRRMERLEGLLAASQPSIATAAGDR